MEDKTIETENIIESADSGNATETRTPETWEELTAAYPELADMPKLKPAYTFSPTETGLFTIMAQHVDDSINELRKLGWFDNKVRARNNGKVALELASMVEYSDRFYRSIAEDEAKYDEFMRGRTIMDLFLMMLTLTRFTQRELGKSTRSKTSSRTAE